MPRPHRTAALAVVALLGGCRPVAAPTDPQLVAQWLRASLAFGRSERPGPPVAARFSADGSIALDEGLAAAGRSRRVLTTLQTRKGA